MNGLMGLSGVGVLHAAAPARVEGGLFCQALAEAHQPSDITPRACESRQWAFDASGGSRKQLCKGAGCPRYQGSGEAAEVAQAARCGCGEPLEPGHGECPDCAADRARETVRKRPRPAGPEEETMSRIKRPAAPQAPQFPIPLPEGARVLSSGRVKKGTNYIKPCPKCVGVWINDKSESCKPCQLSERSGAAAADPGPAADGPAPQDVPVFSLGAAPPRRNRTKGEALTEAQRAIWDECEALAEMLIAKNRAYGNSALDPVRIFSKASPEEQIRVRLDDKRSRLMRGEAAGEDTEQDLLGYLVLLRVHRRAGK